MKIAIIGNAGGGKTTLALSLQKMLGLPLHHIDKIQFLPGWQRRKTEDFEHIHDELIKKEDWIIEGVGPLDKLWERLRAADIIVFVDLSLWRHLFWAMKRQVQDIFYPRVDLPENCPMLPMTWILIKMIFMVHYQVRPKILEHLTGSNKIKWHITGASQLSIGKFDNLPDSIRSFKSSQTSEQSIAYMAEINGKQQEKSKKQMESKLEQHQDSTVKSEDFTEIPNETVALLHQRKMAKN